MLCNILAASNSLFRDGRLMTYYIMLWDSWISPVMVSVIS